MIYVHPGYARKLRTCQKSSDWLGCIFELETSTDLIWILVNLGQDLHGDQAKAESCKVAAL